MTDDRIVRIASRHRRKIISMQARRHEPSVTHACAKRGLICNEIRGLSCRNLWETLRFLYALAA